MTAIKHLALFAYDGAAILCMALVIAACTPALAFAYVDPSVMTYTIQALAGVAVALSAVIGVAFRRSRRVIMRLLKIDENAGKERDPKVHRVDPNSSNYISEMEQADEAAQKAKLNLISSDAPKELSWKARFVRALIVSIFAIGTVFIVAPLEIVSASSTSLIFGVKNIAPLMIAAGLVSSLVLALLLSLIRGKAFDIVLAIVAALGICCYVQALFMNTKLPIADGRSLDLSTYKRITVISSVVWVAVLVGVVFLALKKAKVERIAVLAVSACLIIVQTVGVVSAIAEQGNYQKPVITKEGLFELSAEDNVVVFVLDMFDTAFLNDVLEHDPEALSEFTGFTYYQNSTGSMIPTRYGVPYLLTGRMPDGTQTYDEFMQTWFQKSDFLPDINKAGYDVGIYTDSLGQHIDEVAELAENIHAPADASFQVLDTLLMLDKVALYRDMPWVVKPLFWFSTEDLNNAYIKQDGKAELEYAIADAEYYKELKDRGLEIGENEKSFRFIHLMGSHYPFRLDKNGNASEAETSLLDQSLGVLKIVSDYFREMKELGVYDSATIIVTADHGEWIPTENGINRATSPIFLVKPSETEEEASRPLRISDVPTGHLDYAATIIDGIGGDTEKYGTPADEVTDGIRPRYYWTTLSDGRKDIGLLEYEIKGDALDFQDWKKTGKRIDIDN